MKIILIYRGKFGFNILLFPWNDSAVYRECDAKIYNSSNIIHIKILRKDRDLYTVNPNRLYGTTVTFKLVSLKLVLIGKFEQRLWISWFDKVNLQFKLHCTSYFHLMALSKIDDKNNTCYEQNICADFWIQSL